MANRVLYATDGGEAAAGASRLLQRIGPATGSR